MVCNSGSFGRQRYHEENRIQVFAKEFCIAKVSVPVKSEPVLSKLGNEEICQRFRAVLVVCTYAIKDDRIRDLFVHVFCKRNVSVTLFSVALFLQLVLDNRQAKVHIPYEIGGLTAFSVQLYFHAMDLKSKAAGCKKVNVVRNAVNSRLQAWRFSLCRRIGARQRALFHFGHCWLLYSPTCYLVLR